MINNTPTTNTSHVSLASQNGPIEATMLFCSSDVARGISIPTPKSKPSKMAYMVTAKPSRIKKTNDKIVCQSIISVLNGVD